MRSIDDWQILVGRATSAITQRFSSSTTEPSNADSLDGLLFFGNPHETVPRGLLLDEQLGAVDVLGWQIIRLMTEADRSTAFPTYDQLQPLLRASPGTQASRGTVARVIAVLRLTRWLSLCHKARHGSGRIMGNVYALHDEPLSYEEAALLDADYNSFVAHCLSHNNSTVRAVAEQVLLDMESDGQQSRLNRRAQRFTEVRQSPKRNKNARFSQRTQSENSITKLSSQAEPGTNKAQGEPGSQSELSRKSRAYVDFGPVLSENQGRTVTVRTGNTKKTSTGTEGALTLLWHEQLAMSTTERNELMPILQRLDQDLAQTVLDETAGRVLAGQARRPKGLLRSLINSALSGEFKITRYAHEIRKQRCATADPGRFDSDSSTVIASGQPVPERPIPVVTQVQAALSRQQLLESLGLS